MLDHGPNVERRDESLLTAWRSGDGHAGSLLFERHYDAVARFFRNKVEEPACQDLIQKTFLACLEGRDRFRGESGFRHYVFSIAVRRLNDYFRLLARRRQREHDGLDCNELSVEMLGQSPDVATSLHQEQKLILLGLRRLPLKYQIVLELRYWEDLTFAAMSDILDIPEGTVKSRTRLARDRLESELSQIATSPELLTSTLTSLDDWAGGIRNNVSLSAETKTARS